MAVSTKYASPVAGPSSQNLDIALKDLWNNIRPRQENALLDNGAIIQGATAGKIKTVNAISFKVDGQIYTKAATDDLFDLGALGDVAASVFQAILLCLNAAGTASVVEGAEKTSLALALADVELKIPESLCVVGLFATDGTACDWNDAGGLDAQGTYYNGLPAAIVLDKLALNI